MVHCSKIGTKLRWLSILPGPSLGLIGSCTRKAVWVACFVLYQTKPEADPSGVPKWETSNSQLSSENKHRYLLWEGKFIHICLFIRQSQGNTNTPAIAAKANDNCWLHKSLLILFWFWFSWVPSLLLLFLALIFFICIHSFFWLCYFLEFSRSFGLFFLQILFICTPSLSLI